MRIPAWHYGVLVAVVALMSAALVALRVSPEWGGAAVEEDGPLEWLSFCALAAASAFSFAIQARHRRRGAPASVRRVWLALALVTLFGACEEISYGQRVFGWKSPPWFRKWNDQKETNVHNLKFGKFKVNKAIFGIGLGTLVVLYLVPIPVLHARNARFRTWLDGIGFPVARLHQIAVWGAGILATNLAKPYTRRGGEIQEFAGTMILLLILTAPRNAEAALSGERRP